MLRLGFFMFILGRVVQCTAGANSPSCSASPPTSVDTHCPTVTSTSTVCSTCKVLECLALSTISNPCDCSATVPTVYTGYPCELSKCPGGCASTSYVYATSTSTCPPRPTTPLPDSCTFRPTQTVYSRSGCALACQTDQFCIADAFVTQPCGCPTVVVKPTTTTICPQNTNCIECTTGWGIGTTTLPCSTITPHHPHQPYQT